MKNRFDLENEINELYNFTSQLTTLNEAIIKNELTNYEIKNVLEGMRIMLNLQTEKLYNTMCHCFSLDG